MYDDDNATGTPFIKNGLFDEMSKRIYSDKGFKPEQLSEPAFVDIITDTYRVLTTTLHTLTNKKLADSYIKQEISPELTAALEQNAFMFAGFKIFHEANEIAANLKGDDGGFKPFSTFLKDVKNIDETYNKQYLRAEYNFATASTAAAIKWKEFEEDGDRYNLQYRTAGDERVRDEHAVLHNTTLPPSDPFWSSYYPPNGWNCRCTAVQVRKSKYPESDSAAAIAGGEKATTKIGKAGVNKAAIFRFNPGKEMKLMPPKHPYLPKGCGNCEFRKERNLYDPANPTCQACDAIAKCLSKFEDVKGGRERRKQLRVKAKEKFAGVEMTNSNFNHKVVLSGRNIKEILNQPHCSFNEKNEAILEIDKLFSSAMFIGELNKENKTDDFTSYLFETNIAKNKSWIIVRKYDLSTKYTIYSISDQESLLSHIKTK